MDKIKRLLEELDRILEYTEEPDAFETQSEREMEKALEKEFDKSMLQGYKPKDAKEAILQNLYKHFRGIGFLRDVQLIGNRLQFYMPDYQRYKDWLNDWEQKSQALKNGKLKVFRYNASEGYIVEIQ